MILGRFKNKRPLGQGGFGAVYLVEDEDKQLFALKLISLEKLEEDPRMMAYLEGEIECMQKMNNPHLVKFYRTFRDNNFIYLQLEYCEGGDLATYMGRPPKKVIDLEQAVTIMAEVVTGLEYLHGKGYLHRDIKLQNILVKQEEGKNVFKLADFGLSKPREKIKGTNLGTGPYKAPEIMLGRKYGYEVDMWACGVLFYQMLNRQYPFVLSTLRGESQRTGELRKGLELMKKAEKFSYIRAIEASHYKILQNCTQDMQDLFLRIFSPHPELRLSFLQLQEHPIFKNHFPEVNQTSRLIYSNIINLLMVPEEPERENRQRKEEEKETHQVVMSEKATLHISRVHSWNNEFVEEKKLLGYRKDRIDFLKGNCDQLKNSGSIFQDYEISMLNFNLLKYYIILLKEFKEELNLTQLKKTYPGRKWEEYLDTKQFKELFQEVSDCISQSETTLKELHDQCLACLPAIKLINPHFQASLNLNSAEQFSGNFKHSYRTSTNHCYKILRDLNIPASSGNKLVVMQTMLSISHGFNRIFEDTEQLSVIFACYIKDKKADPSAIDFSDLMAWLTINNKEQLAGISTAIYKFYFCPEASISS